MDVRDLATLVKELGWPLSGVFLLTSFLGGILSYCVTRFIDKWIKVATKKEEEIREIKRKMYEEFIEVIEAILARKDSVSTKEFLDSLNVVSAKMFITVPDKIVKVIKKKIKKKFDANSRKEIYLEIRKDMIGRTSVEEDDLCYFSESKGK